MNDRDIIAEFHSNLVLKQAVMGYSKGDVLESYKKLDSLYREQIEKERSISAEQIKFLTEKVQSLESRVEDIGKQKGLLSAENGSLHREIALLKQSDEERQAYHEKADMLAIAMVNFEREKAAQMKNLEDQRQVIIEQADAEVKELSAKFKMVYSDRVSSAVAEIEALRNEKASIIEKLRQLELLIAQQLKSLDDNHPEEA